MPTARNFIHRSSRACRGADAIRTYGALAAVITLAWGNGCALPRGQATSPLPAPVAITEGPLQVYAPFSLEPHRALLRELASLRFDISRQLELPVSELPLHLHLYETRGAFVAAAQQYSPSFADRRAFFVEQDDHLSIHALRTSRLADDLRHEVTHGYLHGALPHLPLWLDEGLAEFFEPGREAKGWQQAHADLLTHHQQAAAWRPNLARLSQRTEAGDLSQLEYAEAWHWCYQLLETTPPRRAALRSYLQRLREDEAPRDISVLVSALGE